MDKERFKVLVDKYILGNATEEETDMLMEIYQTYQDKSLDWDEAAMGEKNAVGEDLFSGIVRQIDEQEAKPVRGSFFRYAIAASIVLFLTVSGYFLFHKHGGRSLATVKITDKPPGRSQATLTLANGKKIVLGGAVNGNLTSQAAITISKTSNNVLVYTIRPDEGLAQSPSQKNTLTTANGEQYQVILPDGSHVWLNAASSLTYPVAFTGRCREVELNGEAYFEVTHNKAMPFQVKTLQQEVQVLGTHFNINAYQNEPLTSTTLLEGSVKVMLTAGDKAVTIVPGQQAVVKQNGLSVEEVDTDDAVAWKNGYFLFDDEDLESIMRKISRWYDVKVDYTDNALKHEMFSGTISRYSHVSQVIKTLELTNAAHFHLEDNRITVTH